jgi:transketolase
LLYRLPPAQKEFSLRPLSADLSPEGLALAAKTLRVLTVDAVRQAGIGHVGLPLGCAEIGTLLFGEFLRHDPTDPDWHDRDRFVLSAGHGSMLLYGLLHLSGYAVTPEDIRHFRQLHSKTPGHPEHGMTPGVETTTGPLGQGLGNAVGMALAERVLNSRFGSELVDHRTWVLASDGDMMEGVASEACSLAGHLGLGRLIVLYDDNRITIDGPTSLAFSEDVAARFAAYGWDVQHADGQNPEELRKAMSRALESEARPHLIVCRTQIGFGSPAAGQSKAHGAIDNASVDKTRENLGWTLAPFEVPAPARDAFRSNAQRGTELRRAWEARRDKILGDKPALREQWRAMYDRVLPPDLESLLPDAKAGGATRVASGRVLNALAPRVPSLIGGSADLAGSNSTMLKDGGLIEPGKFEGRNIAYGVREHGMASMANGMALHRGLRPFIGTFLVFSDYMRPAIRLAALMQQPVTYVFTHDSIFVGEDGPTHQPVEHLAALRAIPGLVVWRPADARETGAAWTAALRHEGPVAFALTRQSVPVLEGPGVEEGTLRGGYVVVAERDPARLELVIAGTGSETALAVAAARALNDEGRSVRAVSLPSLEVFARQNAVYRASVLPDAAPRLLVEAGVELGVGSLLRPGDRFHGMQGFGASAPYEVLGEHFGFTPAAVTRAARELLK